MKLFVCTSQQLLVYERQEGRWTLTTPLGDRAPQCVALDPSRPERVYCGTAQSGLWRSDDAGHTWTDASSGIPHQMVTSLVVSALEHGQDGGGVVYAGTEPSAVFRSGDGGQTWAELPGLQDLASKPTWSYPPRPETHHVRCIGLDAHEPGRLYVCVENGALVISQDGGQTWEDRVQDSPKDTHTIATHPDAPGRVYASAGDGFVAHGRGYGESRNGGRSWTYPSDGLDAHYGWGLAVDPGDPDTVLGLARPAAGAQPHRCGVVCVPPGRGGTVDARHRGPARAARHACKCTEHQSSSAGVVLRGQQPWRVLFFGCRAQLSAAGRAVARTVPLSPHSGREGVGRLTVQLDS